MAASRKISKLCMILFALSLCDCASGRRTRRSPKKGAPVKLDTLGITLVRESGRRTAVRWVVQSQAPQSTTVHAGLKVGHRIAKFCQKFRHRSRGGNVSFTEVCYSSKKLKKPFLKAFVRGEDPREECIRAEKYKSSCKRFKSWPFEIDPLGSKMYFLVDNPNKHEFAAQIDEQIKEATQALKTSKARYEKLRWKKGTKKERRRAKHQRDRLSSEARRLKREIRMLQQDRNKAKKNTNDPIAIRRSGKSSSSCYVAYQPDLRPNVDANRFLGSLARNPERGPPYQGSGISVNPDRWLKNLGVEYQDVIFELDGEGFERWNELSEKYVNAVMAGRSTAVLSLMRLPKNGLLKWKRIDINIPLIRMLAVSPLQSIRLDPEDVEAGAWRWLDFNGDGQKDLVITGPGYSNIGPLKVYDGKTGCPQAMKQSIEGSLANSKLYVNQAKNIRLLSMKGPPRKRQGLTQLYEINTQKLISIKTSNFQATHVYDLDEDGQFDIYGYVQDRYKKRYYSGYSGADASKIFEGQKGELYERFHRPEHALRAEPDFGAVPRRSFWVKGRGQQAMLLLNKLGGLRSKDERLRFAPHDWNNTQKNVLIGQDANNWDLHDPSVQVVSPVIANVQLLDTNNNGQWEVVGLRKGYFLRLETKFDVLKTPDTVPQKKPETKPQDDIPEILKSGPKSNPSKPKTKRRKRRRGR